MNYVPIDKMLTALQKAGKTDAQLGAIVGLAASSICRMRNGEIKDAKATIYFSIYALWKELAQNQKEKEADQHDRG